MAKANVDDSISLFPFLSILACVIGILVLMIAAIALGQIGRDAPSAKDAAEAERLAEEAQTRIEKYKIGRAQMQVDRKQLAALRRLVAERKVRANELAIARKELADQQQLPDELRRAHEEFLKLQADHERLTKEIEQLETTLEPARKDREAFRAELAIRQTPPKEAQVVILPSGSGRSFKPTFVECASATVVLHDGPQPLRIPTANLAANSEFLARLEDVKNTSNGSMVFLIRPDGVNTYNVARDIARQHYVKNGKLAVGGQGEIDLSRFYRKS